MSEAKEKAGEVLNNVFEEFSFMFGEGISKEELNASKKDLCVNINFKGANEGRLELVVPEAMCIPIAANFLGVEVDDDFVKTRGNDILKELINVICGNFLTSHFGEELVFDLTIPEVNSLDQKQWKAFVEDSETIGFLVDDFPVLLRLDLKD